MTDPAQTPFPYFEVSFDRQGGLVRAAEVEQLIAGLQRDVPTDLFVFAHGWRNSAAVARLKYAQFFGLMDAVLHGYQVTVRQDLRVATLGVFWPSRDVVNIGPFGGGDAAAALGPAEQADPLVTLEAWFPDEPRQDILLELARQLRSDDPSGGAASPNRIQELMRELSQSVAEPSGPEEDIALEVVQGDPAETFANLTDDPNMEAVLEQYGEAIGDGLANWNVPGAAAVRSGIWLGLSHLSFWLNKQRAGQVGEHGLAPVLARIAGAVPDVRIHLIGHSFGARLVAFSLRGIDQQFVKSLLLLQGAFSHSAFADDLHDPDHRSGALAGQAAKVDGPLVATFSLEDIALGLGYPLASRLVDERAAGFVQQLAAEVRAHNAAWGSVGSFGFVNPPAKNTRVQRLGRTLSLNPALDLRQHGFFNLDGNELIREHAGQNAHGDIFHVELAWAALVAAGCVLV